MHDNKKLQDLIRKIISQEGTQVKVAKKLGVSQVTISCWLRGIERPNGKWALKLEKVYGIDRKVSRPDIFDE